MLRIIFKFSCTMLAGIHTCTTTNALCRIYLNPLCSIFFCYCHTCPRTRTHANTFVTPNTAVIGKNQTHFKHHPLLILILIHYLFQFQQIISHICLFVNNIISQQNCQIFTLSHRIYSYDFCQFSTIFVQKNNLCSYCPIEVRSYFIRKCSRSGYCCRNASNAAFCKTANSLSI